MCFNDQRKEESKSFVLRKDSCPIRMDFEVRMFPYERPDNSDGVGMVVKNGHADFWVGSIHIVYRLLCLRSTVSQGNPIVLFGSC